MMVIPIVSWAAGEVDFDEAAVIDHYDKGSLQRGARAFVNYCQGCHSIEYIRYSRIAEDLEIPKDIAQANLAFGGKLFRPVVSSMTTEQAREWFNQAVPPDLSLIARSRGKDWLYNFLRGFYRDGERETGWNNRVFVNTSMPHVLSSLQGVSEYNHETAELSLIKTGKLTETEYNQFVTDLVNFMVYVGEPTRNTRVAIGYGVMIFLMFLLGYTYLLYREYWKKIT